MPIYLYRIYHSIEHSGCQTTKTRRRCMYDQLVRVSVRPAASISSRHPQGPRGGNRPLANSNAIVRGGSSYLS